MLIFIGFRHKYVPLLCQLSVILFVICQNEILTSHEYLSRHLNKIVDNIFKVCLAKKGVKIFHILDSNMILKY